MPSWSTQSRVASLEEAVAHAEGKPGTAGLRTYVPTAVATEVRTLRASLGLSRSAFALKFGLDLRALQDWEQGRRRPDRAARILIKAIGIDAGVVASAAAEMAAEAAE